MNSSNFHQSQLRQTLWSFRKEFLLVGFFSMVANVLMLTPTMYMLQVYDRVLASQSELTLLAVSLITLFFFVVMAFAEWCRSMLLVESGVRLDRQLGRQVFDASFEGNLVDGGKRSTKAFSDLIQIRQFLTANGIIAFFDLPWVPIYMAVLFFLHPWLGFLGLLFALIQAMLAWLGHRHGIEPAEEANRANLEANVFLQSKLRNAETIESMGMLAGLKKLWGERHAHALSQSGLSHHHNHKIMAISKFIRYTQQSLALGAGALLAIDGQLSMGGMIAANVLMSRALAPVDLLVSSWRQFIGAQKAFVRLESLLKDFPAREALLRRATPQGNLTLRNAQASVAGRAHPILSNINLKIESGTVLVVLGPSGSGKSTLARVMLGIWPRVQGEVLLDGQPISSWDRVELGPHIGYLPQDIELFEGTIAENIARFGELIPEAVIEASTNAGLHDMILRLPRGYDTSIGESGGLLSGGQRQRLALARAIYGNPSLIVLDEPNANLDEVGEQALQRAVQALKAMGKTVVLITHRPGAIAVADRILLLKDGQVQMEGPRDQVLSALQQRQATASIPAPQPPSSAA